MVDPLSTRLIDPAGLAPGEGGHRFNASLMPYRGRLLLAYRVGWNWHSKGLHVAELTPDLSVLRSTPLPALGRHPAASAGVEDPRLVSHKGLPHVAFTGVEWHGPPAGFDWDEDCGPPPAVGHGNLRTNQLFARLSADLSVEDVFAPHYPARQGWEKNWGCFDHGGGFYAVHSIRPHVVLAVRSNDTGPEFRTPNPLPWSGGFLRGGAPPVRVGDEYWCWFHGRRDDDPRRYNVGVYCFEARPPFRVTRQTPDPLLWADAAANAARPVPNYTPCVFPAGAFLDSGEWVVSMGVDDMEIRVCRWDHATVGRALSRG